MQLDKNNLWKCDIGGLLEVNDISQFTIDLIQSEDWLNRRIGVSNIYGALEKDKTLLERFIKNLNEFNKEFYYKLKEGEDENGITHFDLSKNKYINYYEN